MSPSASRQTYRIASWATGALAFGAAVMTFAVGLAALSDPGSPPETERVTAGPALQAPLGEVLAPDQSIVTGTVTKVVGTDVDRAPDLVLPLTLTVANRGGGTKADFVGGTVGGKKGTISWDGGRPLPLRGQGSIDLNGPVNVELGGGGASWALDGRSRLLTPGSYAFGATVAVSVVEGGLGTPKDGAKIDVAAGATASVQTRGDVRVATPAAPIQLQGPGKLVLEGALEVKTRDGMRPATKITFGPGAFELSLEPQPGGYRITNAFFQGPTTVDG